MPSRPISLYYKVAIAIPEEGKIVTVNKESLKKNDSVLSCYYLV